jgi:hypothetical protein
VREICKNKKTSEGEKETNQCDVTNNKYSSVFYAKGFVYPTKTKQKDGLKTARRTRPWKGE